MKKLEKLKEINETIKGLLIELETKMFIENIDINNTKKNSEIKSNQSISIK